jgi:hypothetical protein
MPERSIGPAFEIKNTLIIATKLIAITSAYKRLIPELRRSCFIGPSLSDECFQTKSNSLLIEKMDGEPSFVSIQPAISALDK